MCGAFAILVAVHDAYVTFIKVIRHAFLFLTEFFIFVFFGNFIIGSFLSEIMFPILPEFFIFVFDWQLLIGSFLTEIMFGLCRQARGCARVSRVTSEYTYGEVCRYVQVAAGYGVV